MTDLHLPPTDSAAPATPSQRRHLHSRVWWVVATVALGALIGAGLAAWAAPAGHTRTRQVTSTTIEPRTGGPSVPGGLIGGGTAPARPPTHAIDNRVFVVGDSVMQGAAPYLGDLLEGWSVIADTRVGRFLDEGVRVIRKRREDIGEIAVLNLGNNYNGSQEQFATEVDEALGELEGVAHVIWINAGEFEEDRAEVNETLRDAAASRSNLTIVDWNSWWEDNPSFTSGDRLHLTPEGAEAYAALVASAVTQVTQAAGEIPAPGAKSPKLNTSGRIPSSSGSKGTSNRSTRSSGSTRRRTTTTVEPDDDDAGSATSVPPATSAPPRPTSAPTTAAPPPTTPPTQPPTTTPPSPPAGG